MKNVDDSIDELNRERARYTRIKADKEELKLEQMRGELVKVSEVRKEWGDMAANVRKKILALEARLPGMLAGKDIPGMCEVIHEEIYGVLNELAGGYEI